MGLKLSWEDLPLRTTHPFVIARGGSADRQNLLVVVTDETGLTGWGEAAPSRYYGETPETVRAALRSYRDVLAQASPALDRIERQLEQALRMHPSARAAISMALHDLLGKRLGVPLWAYWGLDAGATPLSTFTIAIDQPEQVAERAREAATAEYPILKVKLGGPKDQQVLESIRANFTGEIRVDANAAWSAGEAVRMLPLLHSCQVTMLEQPVAPGDLEGFRRVKSRTELQLIADESCLTSADIPRLAGVVDVVNLKLAKCGSLAEAHRMVAVARAHHLKVMLGCMIESSLGISAMAQLAPLADYADLDGAALLHSDPFIGVTIPKGRITLAGGPGLGVTRR